MLLRFPMYLAMGLLLLASAAAYAAPVPTSTDEARALTGRLLPESTPGHAVAAFPSSTDEARGLAARFLPPTSPRVAIAGIPSSTDEARAQAGWRVPPASSRPPTTAVATKASGTATSVAPAVDPPAQKGEAAPPQRVACQTHCTCKRG
jgi:hypothetical protein